MKTTDIESKYFNHLIAHYSHLKSMCEDLAGFHKIDASAELLATFPSEEALLNMRQSNNELTEKQWHDFWKVIEDMEINLARARVQNSKYNAECKDLNIKHPIQYDKDGYAYREFVDYETGRPCKDYVEMGG